MNEERQRVIFSDNLRFYLETKNKTQLEVANAIGVSPQTFNTWVRGIAIPRMGKVEALANYFMINKSDLIDEHEEGDNKAQSLRIPVLGNVAAGIPIEQIEDVIDWEEIPEAMARGYVIYGLRIKGHSMEPQICDGDTVIVRQQEDAESGDIVIATVNGDDATCKRFFRFDGGIQLVSNNPQFPPMMFTDEMVESKPVRILGKVIELRRSF